MDQGTLRSLARLVAWGRVGVGMTALTAPVVMARPWVGEAADTPAVRLFARAFGGRDLAIGIGALRALSRSHDEARPWIALGGMADFCDTVATLVMFKRLPRRTRWGVLAITVGAATISTRVATALDDQSAEHGQATAGANS